MTTKVKPQRTIRKVSEHIFQIKEGSKTEYYLFAPIKTDWGRGYKLCKVSLEDGEVMAQTEPYYVLLDDKEGNICGCLGHEQWGHQTVCRHISSLLDLKAKGKL